MQWCGHCQSLKPEWERTATALKGILTVAAVDADAHQELGSEVREGCCGGLLWGCRRLGEGLCKARLYAADSFCEVPFSVCYKNTAARLAAGSGSDAAATCCCCLDARPHHAPPLLAGPDTGKHRGAPGPSTHTHTHPSTPTHPRTCTCSSM